MLISGLKGLKILAFLYSVQPKLMIFYLDRQAKVSLECV